MICSFLLAGALLETQAPKRPLLLVHVMPWFMAPPTSEVYGWHWTMNRSQGETSKSGKAASHYQPLLGMYDSKDPDVIECHLLWMKAAGFDGVLADWYGTQNHFDYPMIHERTIALFDQAGRLGLKIGVVYEDQTVKNALANKLITTADTAGIISDTGKWLKENWLSEKNWLKLKTNPVVFVFGPQHFNENDWNSFRSATGKIDLLTLHHPKPYAQGVYDWPVPSQGMEFQNSFLQRSNGSELKVSVAYPRFRDYYEEGGQKGYPDIPDNDGATYRTTLEGAISQKPDAVQTATWNDWQEGTQIEPSVELGYRDLIETQKARKKLDPAFPYSPADFATPLKIYKLRKKGTDASLLDKASRLFSSGKSAEARTILDRH